MYTNNVGMLELLEHVYFLEKIQLHALSRFSSHHQVLHGDWSVHFPPFGSRGGINSVIERSECAALEHVPYLNLLLIDVALNACLVVEQVTIGRRLRRRRVGERIIQRCI